MHSNGGRNNSGQIGVFVALAGCLGLCVVCGCALGSAGFSLSQLWAAVTGQPGGETAGLILLHLRLPRIAGGVLAGAGLAVAGLLLQCATNNDLCSPNVIGVNAGAGLFVMVFLCLFPMAFALLPLAAFAGAVCATGVVLGASFTLGHHTSRATVVLAGVAVGTLCSAGISFLSQLYPDALAAYSSFSVGGVGGLQWQALLLPGILIVLGIAGAQVLAPRLHLLCLGDETAQSLGVRVRRVRLCALLLASALCACVVSFAGLLGFVGLLVPHIARRLLRQQNPVVLVPACALLGASLVVLSDLCGRTLFSPAELPAGILMAAIGAPFFLFLLFQRGRRFD